MANLYLTLDLKNHELYDEDRALEFSFDSWTYDLKNKEFELDNMNIKYDAIYEFKFEKNIQSDESFIELEDETVVNIDVDNEYENFIRTDLILAIENFIGKKDLADGEYKVKYNFYYDFSDEDFVIDILEVEADE